MAENTEAAQNLETAEKGKKKKRVFTGVDSIEGAFIFVMFMLMLFTYVFAVVLVDGPSMNDTLHDKDRLIISKTEYEPKQYDIVIVNCHDANLLDASGNVITVGSSINENIVKRVIATEGQTVDIDFSTGEVIVDGEETRLDFTSSPTNINEGAFEYPITVPEGYCFVMGDNRAVSMDSRSVNIGLVNENDILGKVFYRIAPFGKIGKIQ